MGRYDEAAKKAGKDRKIESMDSTYWKPESKGDTQVGVYLDQFEVQASRGTGTYQQYLIDTDTGIVKFHLGSAGDKEYGEKFKEGELYVFEFDGKVTLPNTNTVNQWKISHVPSELVMGDTGF